MTYRYRMHWYTDPEAPLDAGRPLFGRTPADAIAQAAALWEQEAHAAAHGCCVVDTDDGNVVWRQERDPQSPRRTGPLGADV
jgi:hypothetical protein